MKKICIATGTRAEYGLLKPIIDKVYHSVDMELQLVVTGMHLSTEFGLTYREIEEDGYPIISKIEMLLSSDTAVGITKSMGLALIGFADFFEKYHPDIIIILGDRYEMLAVASAAMIARIPIAHIHGGELTEGAIDEAIRHSITKMSYLHFTSTQEYRNRVIQMGEQPSNVYNVGSLGVESIKALMLMDRICLEEELHFTFDRPTAMVTYHPVTLENLTAERQFGNILSVLNKHKELKVIFTKANSDAHGRIINQMIDCFVEENGDRCISFTSMGQLRYLSSLQFCDMVIGNSSSGLIEAPSFRIPTINIGDRQRGRVCAESVVHCGNKTEDIECALQKVLRTNFKELIKGVNNPYEGLNTSEKILEVVNIELSKGIELKKKFYNIELNI